MSEELFNDENESLELNTEAGEEFEEISSEEVDRVVAALEGLIESTPSENICTYLEEALNSIYYLVYDEDEDDDAGEIAEAA